MYSKVLNCASICLGFVCKGSPGSGSKLVMFIKNLLVLWFILPFFLTSTSNGDEHPTGHLQPLGAQLPAVGEVFTVHDVPSPEEFFKEYVQPGKPVLFKGAATKIPAYNLWTDEYISSKYGELKVDVEEGKKENRSKELFHMPLRKFIKIYNESDLYLVYSLPKTMRDEVFLLKCISCGGFSDSIEDTVMWFSSGGTKSVLHFDAIDNINCLMSGSKDLFMVDKKEKAHINIDNEEGSYSGVDVDKVDLYKYPGLADVPWYHGRMEAGDCLFIPYRWFHQVRSFGPRNLAINVWFSHRLTFNSTDCETRSQQDKDFARLSDFTAKQSYEPSVKLLLYDEMEEKPVNFEKWVEIWQNVYTLDKSDPDINDYWQDLMKAIFDSLDTNKDALVSPKEVTDGSISEQHEEMLRELFSENEEDDKEGEYNEERDDLENEITQQNEKTEYGRKVVHDDL